MKTALRVVGAAVAVTGFLSGCATQTPEPVVVTTQPVPSQQTSVVMRVQGGETEPQSFEVTCKDGKAEGTHPNLEGACDVLLNADFALFTVDVDKACPEIYGGDNLAIVVGHVKGKGVSTEFSRINGCEIARWDAMVPLLPQANDTITEFKAPNPEE